MGVYRPMRVKAGREAQLPAPFSSFDELTGLFLSAVASPQSRPPLHPLRSPYKPHDPAQVFFESDTTFLLLPQVPSSLDLGSRGKSASLVTLLSVPVMGTVVTVIGSFWGRASAVRVWVVY